jgi:hypothetical protein
MNAAFGRCRNHRRSWPPRSGPHGAHISGEPQRPLLALLGSHPGQQPARQSARPAPPRRNPGAVYIVPLSPSRVIAAGDAPNAGERMSAIRSRCIAALGLLATGLTGCITAAEQATPIRPITCTAGADCDAKWSRAASWIALNPTWKIKTRTDQFIEITEHDTLQNGKIAEYRVDLKVTFILID